MIFKELKRILLKENINPVEYDILNKGYVYGVDGYMVENSYKGYKLYYMERGEKVLLEIMKANMKYVLPS